MAVRGEDSAFPVCPTPRGTLALRRRDSTAPGRAGPWAGVVGGAAGRYFWAAAGRCVWSLNGLFPHDEFGAARLHQLCGGGAAAAPCQPAAAGTGGRAAQLLGGRGGRGEAAAASRGACAATWGVRSGRGAGRAVGGRRGVGGCGCARPCRPVPSLSRSLRKVPGGDARIQRRGRRADYQAGDVL